MCYKNHKKLFTYRIREKNDGSGYVNSPVHIDGENNTPEKYRFVQNIYCLMTLSVRNCLMIRNPKEMLLWDNKTVSKIGEINAENNVVSQLVENSKKHAKKFGRDISQLTDEKIFEGYISKFYNIRECEKYLFGNNETNPMSSQNS